MNESFTHPPSEISLHRFQNGSSVSILSWVYDRHWRFTVWPSEILPHSAFKNSSLFSYDNTAQNCQCFKNQLGLQQFQVNKAIQSGFTRLCVFLLLWVCSEMQWIVVANNITRDDLQHHSKHQLLIKYNLYRFTGQQDTEGIRQQSRGKWKKTKHIFI